MIICELVVLNTDNYYHLIRVNGYKNQIKNEFKSSYSYTNAISSTTNAGVVQPADIPSAWMDMKVGCINEMKRQIQTEIDASITYLAMGAHFSQDTVNRPGFAKFFFESAAEEREHGHKLIEYLLMRGELVGANSEITNLITVNPPGHTQWESGVEALKDALRTEAKVTKSIRRVIEKCEADSDFNDYHVCVDWPRGTRGWWPYI